MKFAKYICLATLFALNVCACKHTTNSYKIGSIISLTGPLAEYGNPVWKGMLLAEEEINSNGGINGKKIKIIVENDASLAKNAIGSANKLINIDKISVIIGPLSSGNSMAVAPISEKSKIVQISTLAGIPDLTSAGDYIFRIYPSSTVGAHFAIEKAIKYFSPKKVAILYPSNPFGEVSNNIYQSVCNENNVEVCAIESYMDGATDFHAQLTKISICSPDIILCSAYWIDGANIVKQMIEMNMKVPIIGEDGWHGPIFQLIGKHGVKLIYFADILFGNDVNDNKKMHFFMEKFKLKYNQNATTAAAVGYDAVYLTVEAIKNSGYYSDSIKNFLYRINYDGALGKIKYDSNGDNIGLSLGLFQMDTLNNVQLIIK